MKIEAVQEELQTLAIRKEIEIHASLAVTFASVLEEIGPGSEMPDGTAFLMKLEAWPGGRWYRDLGNNSGHLWGHVQVIKPPTLLELSGPMFMSYPAMNFVQYRLESLGDRTKLTLTHRAFGLIIPEHREGVQSGWEHGLRRVEVIAKAKMAQRQGSGQAIRQEEIHPMIGRPQGLSPWE